MTGYIHNEYAQPRLTDHRARAASSSPTQLHDARAAARRLSSALLATVLSTLIVLADRVVDAWTSGGLLLALLVLWLVLFTGLQLFVGATRRLALWAVAAVDAAAEDDARQGANAPPVPAGNSAVHTAGDMGAAQHQHQLPLFVSTVAADRRD